MTCPSLYKERVTKRTFKSTYQILKELSEVWDDLTDVSQANILAKIAGKRNANAVAAVINRFDVAERALQVSQNADGSALKENEKVLDSVQGKLNQLTAAWQTLSTSVLQATWLKWVIDLFKILLETLNKLNEVTGGVSSFLLGLIIVVTTVRSVVGAFQKNIGGLKTVLEVLSAATKGTFAPLAKLSSLLGGVSSQATATTLATKGLSMATMGYVGMAIAAAWGLMRLYEEYRKANPTLEELQAKYEDAANEASALQTEIDANYDRIKELQQLSARGKITLVEQDELDRLREANRQLELQKTYLESLRDDAKAAVQQKGLEEFNRASAQQDHYNEYGMLTGTSSEIDDLEQRMREVASWQEQLEAELEKAGKEQDQALITQLRNRITTAKGEIAEELKGFEELTSSFEYTAGDNLTVDQQQMNEAIRLIDMLRISYVMLSDDVAAAQTAWDYVLSSSAWSSPVESLRELANAGELTAEKLQELMDQSPEVAAFINLLSLCGLIDLSKLDTQLGLLSKQLKTVSAVAKDIKAPPIFDFEAAAKSISGSITTLQKAMEEMRDAGHLSIDTVKALKQEYPGLAKYLITTADGYYLTDGALNDYISEQRSEYSIALNQSKQAAAEVLRQQGIQADAYDETTAAIKRKLQAQMAEASALINADRNAYFAVNGNDAISRSLWAAERSDEVRKAEAELSALSKAFADLNGAQYQLDQVDAFTSTVRRSGSSSKSSSSADKWKEEAEAKIALLKHQREMEEITSAQYYDGLEAIENAYYKNSGANQKKYAAEIRSIDEELFTGRRELFDDWMNDQEHQIDLLADARNIAAQERAYQELLASIEQQITKAKDYGLDENSDYIQTLRDSARQYQEDWLNLVKDTYDEYIDYMDDFDLWNRTGESRVATLEKELAEIDALYERGALSWTAYVQAHNETAKNLYDSQKDAMEEIIDRTMEMIKQESQDQIDAIDDQIEAFDDLINKKKELLRETREEADYEDEVAEKVQEISKLQSQISQLSLDDSRDATAQRIALEEQLAEKQKELEKFQRDHALDATEEALDKEAEAYKDAKEDEKELLEKSIDSWVKLYEKAMDRIINDWDSLYDDLMDYEMEHRDSIDGPDSLVTAWDAASKAVEKYGSFIAALDQNGESLGINPNANFGQAADILREMEENSRKAKEAGTSQIGDVNLHDRNQKLADQYYRLTGETIRYDESRGWYFVSSGKLAYGTEPSRPASSSPSQSDVGGGNAYQATKSKYGAEPTGTLKVGSTNTAGVKWLQYYLKQLGLFPYAVDGTFYTRTKEALEAFQEKAGITPDGIYGPATRKKLPLYHTGGVVDGTGAINSKEVLAILQKGELVLTARQKDNLRAILGNIKAGLSGMLSNNLTARMESMGQAVPAGAVSPTFSPTINVIINHSGKMTDADVDKYGRKIANTALDTLYNTMRTRGIK